MSLAFRTSFMAIFFKGGFNSTRTLLFLDCWLSLTVVVSRSCRWNRRGLRKWTGFRMRRQRSGSVSPEWRWTQCGRIKMTSLKTALAAKNQRETRGENLVRCFHLHFAATSPLLEAQIDLTSGIQHAIELFLWLHYGSFYSTSLDKFHPTTHQHVVVGFQWRNVTTKELTATQHCVYWSGNRFHQSWITCGGDKWHIRPENFLWDLQLVPVRKHVFILLSEKLRCMTEERCSAGHSLLHSIKLKVWAAGEGTASWWAAQARQCRRS